MPDPYRCNAPPPACAPRPLGGWRGSGAALCRPHTGSVLGGHKPPSPACPLRGISGRLAVGLRPPSLLLRAACRRPRRARPPPAPRAPRPRFPRPSVPVRGGLPCAAPLGVSRCPVPARRPGLRPSPLRGGWRGTGLPLARSGPRPLGRGGRSPALVGIPRPAGRGRRRGDVCTPRTCAPSGRCGRQQKKMHQSDIWCTKFTTHFPRGKYEKPPSGATVHYLDNIVGNCRRQNAEKGHFPQLLWGGK